MNLIVWKISLFVLYKCIRWNFIFIFFKYNYFKDGMCDIILVYIVLVVVRLFWLVEKIRMVKE